MSGKRDLGFIRKGILVIKYPDASLALKALMLAVVTYIISPVDFLPEAVFGPFGLVDDAGALATLAWLAKTAYAYYAYQQKNAQ